MHEAIFADACRPAPAFCLRLPLLTYTIGHELLLIQTRNPLVCMDDTSFNALPADLQRASLRRSVIICSRDWEQHDKPQRFLRLWKWVCDKFCVYELEIAQFRNYLAAAHVDYPPPDPRADDVCASANGYEPMRSMRGRTYGSPHIARLINFVAPRLKTLDSSLKTVFDCPYALANQLYITHLESEGNCRVENSEERAAAEEYKRHVVEALAEELAEAEKSSGQKSEASKPTGLATAPPDLDFDPSEIVNRKS